MPHITLSLIHWLHCYYLFAETIIIYSCRNSLSKFIPINLFQDQYHLWYRLLGLIHFLYIMDVDHGVISNGC